MWIVNQDEKELINYDRITEIIVKDKEILITDDIYKEDGEIIGTYVTEERAKEVLEEIINVYTKNEALKGADSLGSIAINTFKEVYRMPKE